jgi:hypothetical protein
MLVRVVTVTFIDVPEPEGRTLEEAATREIEKALRERRAIDSTITDVREAASAKDVAA